MAPNPIRRIEKRALKPLQKHRRFLKSLQEARDYRDSIQTPAGRERIARESYERLPNTKARATYEQILERLETGGPEMAE